jgi:DNA-binding NtrC family response regulator
VTPRFHEREHEGGGNVNSNECKRVLLVDHDEAFGPVLTNVLGSGYCLTWIPRPEDTIPILERDGADVVLLNWDDEADSTGQKPSRELLRVASELPLAPPVLVFSWDAMRKTAIEALGGGAFDFFLQPLSVFELRFAIDRAYRRIALARELMAAQHLVRTKCVDGLLGNSKAMEHVSEIIHKVAQVSTTVLISGESGTGKEVVARAIHRLSSRANKPFVAFSACALPDSLMEDELFGHGKGAFTGAAQSRKGRFEEAQGGTVFLDEIGDLALPLQAKLLRVLQEREVERLGSNVPIPLDVRVICATNRNLEEMVRQGTFRQDLYFRVSVVKLALPSLQDRAEDIPLLADHFLRTFSAAHGKEIRGLSPGLVTALAGYEWPGNVRELQNVIERCVVLADGAQLRAEDLPPEISHLSVSAEIHRGSFQESVRSFKREMLRSALRLHNGNKLRAAQDLHISRCYLHRLLNQLDLHVESEDGEDENLMTPDELTLSEPEAQEHTLVAAGPVQ